MSTRFNHPILRKLVVLGIPAVIGCLEIFHPASIGAASPFQVIMPITTWWLTLHILQLPLFYLLALTIYLLLQGIQSKTATASRIALGVFVIFYPAFDAIIGIGTGTLVRYAISLPINQRVVLGNIVDVFWHSPIANVIAIVGTLSWAVATLMALMALMQPKKLHWFLVTLALLFTVIGVSSNVLRTYTPAWIALVGVAIIAIIFALTTRPFVAPSLLLLASFFFAITHTFPFGPLGMLCLFLAALQLELRQSQSTAPVLAGREEQEVASSVQ